ncbi:tetratricopeptide repeat protein [Planctomycetota bacterium]
MQGAVGWLVLLVVLATSIWVLIDAKTIGVRKGLLSGFVDMGPWGWFFACLLLWIIGFPLYLAMRPELKKTAARGRRYRDWGVALAQMGKRDEAEEKWAKALELDPALKSQIEEMRKQLLGKD